MKSSSLYTLMLFLLFSIVLLSVSVLSFSSFRYGSFGTNDFIEYWSSYRVLSAQNNPYDPAKILVEQQKLDPQRKEPLMMWNPPWVFLLIVNVADNPFPIAAKSWFWLNIIFLALSALFLSSLAKQQNTPYLLTFTACMLFFPVWYALQLGQLSVFLVFAVTGLYWSLVRRYDYLAGAFLAMLTIKPHLVALLGLVVLWWLLRNKRWGILASSFCFTMLLIGVVGFCFGDLLWFWVESFGAEYSGVPAPRDWVVATAAGVVRLIWLRQFEMCPVWPMIVVPGIISVMVLGYLILKVKTVSWHEQFPFFLCLSLIAAPFGWLFDQSLLVVLQAVLAQEAVSAKFSPKQGGILLLCLVLANVTLFVHCLYFAKYQHEFFWFPFLLLALWLWSRKAACKHNKSQTSING